MKQFKDQLFLPVHPHRMFNKGDVVCDFNMPLTYMVVVGVEGSRAAGRVKYQDSSGNQYVMAAGTARKDLFVAVPSLENNRSEISPVAFDGVGYVNKYLSWGYTRKELVKLGEVGVPLYDHGDLTKVVINPVIYEIAKHCFKAREAEWNEAQENTAKELKAGDARKRRESRERAQQELQRRYEEKKRQEKLEAIPYPYYLRSSLSRTFYITSASDFNALPDGEYELFGKSARKVKVAREEPKPTISIV